MEYRELYDINRNKIGKCILKGEKVPKETYYVSTIAFMENIDGKFLIQKRTPEKGNCYGLTGGHPKKSESSIEGLIREVKEELDLDISNEKSLYFHTYRNDHCFIDLYYVRLPLDINKLTLQKEEVTEVKLLTLEEIQTLIDNNNFFPDHEKIFSIFLKNYYNNIKNNY